MKIIVKDIQNSIEFVKSMTPEEHTRFVIRDFSENLPDVSKYINGGHYRIINKTERISLNYYFHIAYTALNTTYGEPPRITEREMKLTKEEFLDENVWDIPKTDEPELDGYLRNLIHAEEYVRLKSVPHMVASVNAFIQLYVEKSI